MKICLIVCSCSVVMARNPVFLSPQNLSQFQSSFPQIIAVIRRISVEYTNEFPHFLLFNLQ